MKVNDSILANVIYKLLLGSIEMLEYVNNKTYFTIDVVRVFASACVLEQNRVNESNAVCIHDHLYFPGISEHRFLTQVTIKSM